MKQRKQNLLVPQDGRDELARLGHDVCIVLLEALDQWREGQVLGDLGRANEQLDALVLLCRLYQT